MRRPLPAAATKCGCGHAVHEHVQGGDQHACQHGAQPPFTQMCPCKRFRTKEEELAHAELKRQSRRDRSKKRAEGAVEASSPATVGPKTPAAAPQEIATGTKAAPAGSAAEEPPKSSG